MNPYDEVQRGRLFKAMEHSYRRLSPFRSLVASLVEEYAGSAYGAGRPRHATVMNLMNQVVDAYTMSLAANRPRVLVTEKYPELAAFAAHYQVAINKLVEEIQLEHTLRQAVLDAFFCIGICKVHMADSVQVEVEEGFWMDPGQPYVSNITLDNWVYDTAATEWHKVQFAGDQYRIPYETLRMDIFDQKVARKAQPSSKYTLDEGERLENISKGYDTDYDEVEPMVDVMDVWHPRDRKIYTFLVDSKERFSGKHDPLAVLDQDDPERGPYHRLTYNTVPGNIMPSSPASHLAEMSRLINNIIRKQGRRVRNHKRVTTYTPAGAQDAQKINRSSDGDTIEVQDVEAIGQFETPGVDPQAQMFFGELVDLFDRMSGNLTAMLGLGAQAETAAQERLIHGAVSQKEAQMRYQTLEFSKDIVSDLGWLLWRDSYKVIPGQIPVEGAEGYFMDATWRPEYREGEFADYNMDIDVYSMAYQSPAQRAQAITQLLTQVYFPGLPILSQQGGTINMQQVTDMYAELLNLPRLKNVVQFAYLQPPGGAGGAGGMPNTSSREYIRKNVPTGGTVQGRNHVRQQTWANQGQVNQDQAASLRR